MAYMVMAYIVMAGAQFDLELLRSLQLERELLLQTLLLTRRTGRLLLRDTARLCECPLRRSQLLLLVLVPRLPLRRRSAVRLLCRGKLGLEVGDPPPLRPKLLPHLRELTRILLCPLSRLLQLALQQCLTMLPSLLLRAGIRPCSGEEGPSAGLFCNNFSGHADGEHRGLGRIGG